MTLNTSSPNSIDPSLWLKEFTIKVSSNSDRVYNNGRQQIEISLIVEAHANQEVTDAQFNTLKPVYLDDDGNYVALPHIVSADDWWYADSENPAFDYLPSSFKPEPMRAVILNADGSDGQMLEVGPDGNWLYVGSAESASVAYTQPSSARRVKRFYVQSQSRAGTNITLYASIEKDQDTVYYSKNTDSDITLFAEQSPTFNFPDDYNWTQRKIQLTADQFSSEDSDARFIYEFSLTPRHVRFSYAEFHPDSPESKGMIRWQDHTPDQTFASHVGVALPGCKDIHYNDTIRLGTAFPPRKATTVSAENPDAIVVLLQGDNQILYYSEGSAQQGPLKLQAYDRYGTLHTISITFDDSEGSAFDKRTRLAVSTHSSSTTDDNFVNITHFQVKGLNTELHKQVCKLYNNGLQQIYINVVLSAVNASDETVQLSQDVLDKVQLVDYDTGNALSPLLYWVSRSQSALDKRFHLLPATLANDAPPCNASPAQGGQSITFWIKTPISTNRTIGARLVHNGVTYHTYQKDIDPGGKTVSGRSNSAAVISPIPQDYHYSKYNFSLERENSSVELGRDIYDVDTYTIRIKSASHYIVWSNIQDKVWMYDYIGNKKANYLACYQCNSNRSSVLYFNDRPQRVYINSKPGDASAARVKAYKNNYTGETWTSLQVTYYDQYGNGHKIYLKPTEEANLIILG